MPTDAAGSVEVLMAREVTTVKLRERWACTPKESVTVAVKVVDPGGRLTAPVEEMIPPEVMVIPLGRECALRMQVLMLGLMECLMTLI